MEVAEISENKIVKTQKDMYLAIDEAVRESLQRKKQKMIIIQCTDNKGETLEFVLIKKFQCTRKEEILFENVYHKVVPDDILPGFIIVDPENRLTKYRSRGRSTATFIAEQLSVTTAEVNGDAEGKISRGHFH